MDGKSFLRSRFGDWYSEFRVLSLGSRIVEPGLRGLVGSLWDLRFWGFPKSLAQRVTTACYGDAIHYPDRLGRNTIIRCSDAPHEEQKLGCKSLLNSKLGCWGANPC